MVSVREAPIAYMADLPYATQRIVDGDVPAYIIDNAYLLVYDVVQPWYSRKEMLVELLVLRIGQGSKFSAVTDLLHDLGEEFDTSMTHVGSSFSRAPSALVRLYSRQGFVDEGKPSLIKRR